MTFCSAQAWVTTFLAFGTDTLEFEQSRRTLFDDVEHRFTKRTDQFPGKVGTDALDHPGTEVFFDTLQRTRRDDAKLLSLEL